MLRVGVIVSSWHYFDNPFKLQPLYELYYATVIDHLVGDKYANVSVVDLRQLRKDGKGITEKTIKDYIPEQDLYVYWLMKTADYPEVLTTVDSLRSVYPNAKHVAGGTHVEHFTEDCKKYFDTVIRGPGERPLYHVINALIDGFYDDREKFFQENWGESKYDDWPIARRNYLPVDAIVNRDLFCKYGGVLGTSAMLQRGCNFNCTYCIYNVPNMIQARSPESVKEEINYLKREYKIEGLNLRDEVCIPANRKTDTEFLEAIGSCDIIWRGQTRVGVCEEIIKLAAESGCVELSIGVETASPQVLDLIDKHQTFDLVRDFIIYSRRYGIKIKMCLILGLPGEPPDIVEVTRKYIDETNPDYVAISGFCPVLGSVIYNNYKEYGIKRIDTDWSKHAHLMHRFSDDEDFGLPFEYEAENKWGKTFTRKQIAENIQILQQHCRDKGMLY